MEYENKHWEFPPGSEVLPITVIRRYIEQGYGRFAEKTLGAQLQHHGHLTELLVWWGLSPSIVDKLVIYRDTISR